MTGEDRFALATKRIVIGQVSVCVGCCCGNTANGKPPVPVDWLKKEWRARGLLKRVQLTISGCLGPCDVPNVVTISDENGNAMVRGNQRIRAVPRTSGMGGPLKGRGLVAAAAKGISKAQSSSIPRKYYLR
jgi:hypothetical protein